VTTPNSPSTDFGYTGQRQLDADMGGLMDYKARFYSPYINHFVQPDSLIPDPSNPQAWNRYSYVGNNPIGYSDPSGHQRVDDGGSGGASCGGQGQPSCQGVPGNGGSPDDDDLELEEGLEKDLKSTEEESLTFIGPNPNAQNSCRNGNLNQFSGPLASELFQDARGICGKFDPTLLNPELGGTNFSYGQSVRGLTEYLFSLNPNNPVNRGIFLLAPAAPAGCFVYNCAYDVLTDTGEHNNLRDVSVTPQSVGYTVIAVPIAIPAAIEATPLIIGLLLALFGL